jgi:hypothetical protein
LEVGDGRCLLGKKRLEMWCEVTNFVDSFINIIHWLLIFHFFRS